MKGNKEACFVGQANFTTRVLGARHFPRRFQYINNKLLWARKYARIVVRGYYLFQEANSCPRVKLEGNCELWGTDSVQGQLFVHISSHSESSGAKQNYKTKHEAKSGDFLVLSGTAFSTSFPISSPANWRKTLHFEIILLGKRGLLAVSGHYRLITSARVTIPPITHERKYFRVLCLYFELPRPS